MESFYTLFLCSVKKRCKQQYSKVLLSLFFSLAFSLSTQAQYTKTVAKDGSGDYTTVQAAIDAASTSGYSAANPYKIYIKAGTYTEKVVVNKQYIQLIGESVASVIISWGDYSGKSKTPSGTYGTSDSYTLLVSATDCSLINVTVENTTGHTGDGPQAVALSVTADRCAFKNCRFIGGQDTLLADGDGKHQYFKNCYIDGNTDFIFGSSMALFEDCIIYARDRVDGSSGGYITAAKTPSGQSYGYVFKNCIIPPNRGLTTYTLGRPWGTNANVVFMNTTMSTSVKAVGWQIWDTSTDVTKVNYAEYKSVDFAGAATDLSSRVSWSKQLTDVEAANYTVSNILGGWDPCTVSTDMCTPFSPELAVSNFTASRGSANTTLTWNLSWAIDGVTFDLYRSTDNVSFSKVGSSITSSGTTQVAFSTTQANPASGVTYYYYLQASKSGYTTYKTATEVVNTSVPLAGDFRSTASGTWQNIVYTSLPTISVTVSAGKVTAASTTSAGSFSGITSATTVGVYFTGTAGYGAYGTLAITSTGTVASGTALTITNQGTGYTGTPTAVIAANASSIWEKYNTSTGWTAVASNVAPTSSATNTTIQSGHTVMLSTLVSCTNLEINTGATLNAIATASNGGTVTIRPSGASVIANNGTLGSTTGFFDGVLIEAATTCSSLKLTGTGTTSIARFRPAPPNTNAFVFTVDQDMSINYNNVAFTAYYNSASNTNAESSTITINAGKTVTIANAAGGIHGGSSVVNKQGTIVYNIYGTLDLGATTTATNIVPAQSSSTGPVDNSASSVTVNIKSTGKLITGTSFNAVSTTSSTGTAAGTVKFNVEDGGVIDATKATTFTMGTTPFIFNGTSASMMRTATQNTNITFPVATSSSTYNPVVVNNAGTSKVVTVSGLTNTTSGTISTGHLNKQWTIDAVGSLSSGISVGLGWTSADQGTLGSSPSAIIKYSGSSWFEMGQAAVSGSGTIASPSMITLSGLTSLGTFSVADLSTLPLESISLKAQAGFTNEINLAWSTQSEINVKEFIVERENKNGVFESIGNVSAKTGSANNTYSFVDWLAPEGRNYYRLKIADQDGSFKYSAVSSAVSSKVSELLVYPNPSSGSLTVNHLRAEKNASLSVFSLSGEAKVRVNLVEGTSSTPLNLSSLIPGFYTIKLQNGSQIQSVKFIKQ